MRLIVIASEAQKAVLLSSVPEGAAIAWAQSIEDLLQVTDADVYMDLLFTGDAARLSTLTAAGKSIIVHSVVHTLQDIGINATRINAWPGFLQSEWIEAAGSEENKELIEQAFTLLGKKVQWLPDEPGFVSARVISMIINEAYLALEEGVSTKEEINTAMKLGTNYPFGPFEWGEQIGISEVKALLEKLTTVNARYQPAKAMQSEEK